MRAALALALCLSLPPAGAATVTVVVAGADGGPLSDAVVALDPADGPVAAATSPPAAAIDQVNKRFVPRIAVIRTGTAVSFPNSDHIRHQVYSFSPPHPFNLKLYAGSAAPPVVFEHAGLVVLGCNIHDTMVGFVAVVDTPYFGRTDAHGRIGLDAPAGRYRLRVWHPELAAPVAPRAVALTDAPSTLTVQVARGADPTLVAPWTD